MWSELTNARMGGLVGELLTWARKCLEEVMPLGGLKPSGSERRKLAKVRR